MNLRDKRGNLTAYAFTLGYVERSGPFTLGYANGAYHVRGVDGDGVRHAVNVRTLTDARRSLRALATLYGRSTVYSSNLTATVQA